MSDELTDTELWEILKTHHKISGKKTCVDCNGTGYKGSYDGICTRCQGTGTRRNGEDPIWNTLQLRSKLQ